MDHPNFFLYKISALIINFQELETECNKVEAEYEDSLLALNSKLPEEMFQQIDRYIFHLRLV